MINNDKIEKDNVPVANPDFDSSEIQSETIVYHKPFNEMNMGEKIKFYLLSWVYGPDNWFTCTIVALIIILWLWHEAHRFDPNDPLNKIFNHLFEKLGSFFL